MNNIKSKINRIDNYVQNTPLTLYSSLYMIIVNVTNKCNRTCSFCPHSKSDFSNNMDYMPLEIIDELIKQTNNKFQGIFSISGFGEPLLHPDINAIIEKLNSCSGQTVLTTNGVNPSKLLTLKPNQIDISIYDKKTEKQYKALINEFSVPVFLKLQYKKGNTFFNNRAGNAGEIKDIPNTCCNIPFMKLTIDTNGDILLCCSDWKREFILGNILKTNIWDIWQYKFKGERTKLLNNSRAQCILCSRCNSPGNLYGDEFKEFWERYYGKY